MNRQSAWETGPAVLLMCVASAIGARAQTFTTLLSFSHSSGGNPNSPLVQGIDGNLYGTTEQGGPKGDGIIFKITPEGTISTVHYFQGPDGAVPSGLVLLNNGNFYGTTSVGGIFATTCFSPQNCGTVFGFTSAGTLFTLHNFSGPDGVFPTGLVLAWDGNLYGTTQQGGSGCNGGCGIVFKITPSGRFTVLHYFNGNDGSIPNGPVVQATNGSLYGTTGVGGLYGYGTIFEITLGGALTTLHNFDKTDGANPLGSLVQASDGQFYGTTVMGGKYNWGTVFVMSPSGQIFNRLHDFTGGTDGGRPACPLVQGNDGNFYGATSEGGSGSSYGTLFGLPFPTTHLPLSTLHTFDGSDGGRSVMLMQATNGAFYGTTGGFGANNNCPASSGCGTAFSLATDLGPFVTTVPWAGGWGKHVLILGNHLTGTTNVSFNGTPATFTVVSDTEIATTVPIGTTKGYVTVTTPSGTLSSKAIFIVP